VHAAVLFSMAEAASAQALLNHFPDLADSAVPLLRASANKCRRPADADHALIAQGKIAAKQACTFRQHSSDRGLARIGIEITVTVTEADQEVFRGAFSWFVTTRG
jgi:hypothetical protein